MEDDIDFVVPNETVNNAIDKFTREKIDEGWTPDEGSDMNRCVSRLFRSKINRDGFYSSLFDSDVSKELRNKGFCNGFQTSQTSKVITFLIGCPEKRGLKESFEFEIRQ